MILTAGQTFIRREISPQKKVQEPNIHLRISALFTDRPAQDGV
jgi:hypothetical protein